MIWVWVAPRSLEENVRIRRMLRVGAIAVIAALVATACGSEQVATQSTDAAASDSGSVQALGPIPGFDDWDAVLAAAEGQTVNFHLWGGDDTINSNVDTDIGDRVSDLFGITLNRVPLADTADAVNLVLNEIEAGRTEDGSVDMIWINGENFRTLKEADAVFLDWSESIPNSAVVDWDDPAVANDFGEPVDGAESPWGHAQFVFEFNTALVGETPPQTFEDLQQWVHDNPGLFTYPAIPDFTGSVFLRHLFYWAAGGSDDFQGEFDQAVFDEHAPQVWAYLNDLAPDLWRGGETYPTEAAILDDLLANQETAFSMNYTPSHASTLIRDGSYPETIRTFIPETGSVSNNNYVTIPSNAANKAAALVVADYMLSEEYQLELTNPDGWGWLTATDPNLWTDEAQSILDGYDLGVATLSQSELNANALPEPSAAWVEAMEQGWLENVL